MRNPLALPSAAIDALLTLSEVASRLPRILAEAEVRAQTVMEDIAAMRAAVAPLEELTNLRKSIEPVASAAEPVARLRERLPGGG